MKVFEYNLLVEDENTLNVLIEHLILKKIIIKNYQKISKFRVPCVRIKSDKNYVTLNKVIKKLIGNKFILKRWKMASNITFDSLASMDDRELYSLYGQLKSDLYSQYKSRSKYKYENITQIETDLCYIQREVDLRVKRKEIHQEYLEDLKKNKKNFN